MGFGRARDWEKTIRNSKGPKRSLENRSQSSGTKRSQVPARSTWYTVSKAELPFSAGEGQVKKVTKNDIFAASFIRWCCGTEYGSAFVMQLAVRVRAVEVG